MADNNYRSWWGTKGLRIVGLVFPNAGIEPKDYSDTQKFSICEDTLVDNCVIYTAKENGADAVRGKKYIWNNCTFASRGKGFGALTIKGSIDGWTLSGCRFDGHGDKYDVEVGQFDNYWYPFRKPTRNGRIVNCVSDRPILVELWDADAPVIVGSNVKIVKKPWFIWFPYFLFRYIQTKFTKGA